MRGIGELGSLVVTTVLLCALVIGGTLFYGGVQNQYNVTGFTNASNATGVYTAYGDINATVNEMATDLQNSGASTDNPQLLFLTGGISALKRVFSFLNVFQDLASGVTNFFVTAFGASVGWFAVLILAGLSAYVAIALLQVVIGRSI